MPPINIPEQFIHSARSLFSSGGSTVVAVSGGSDSVALLFLLHEFRERLGISRLVVAHVNHGLRGAESDGDEQLVRQHAETLGLDCFCRLLDGHAPEDPGMEAWAREERYRFFNEIRRNSEANLIATGHTLDDQAETVLMRIIRGAGLNGLRGIAPSREDGVVRPLLQCRKQDLEAWLGDRGIAFRVDRSNADHRFLRNRIRHTVLPKLAALQPNAAEHIAALAAEADLQWQALGKSVAAWIDRSLFAPDATSFQLKTDLFSDTVVASEALRQLLSEKGIHPTHNRITEILTHSTRTGGTFLLPGKWRYRCARGVLCFYKKLPRFRIQAAVPGVLLCPEGGRKITIEPVRELPDLLDMGRWMVMIDGASVGSALIYRTISTEDTFIPFGIQGEVNVLHFLSKQGVPRPLRERTGILTTMDNKPVWLHGIRLDERFRVTKATKSLIKLQSESIL
jgi:tRNA(Ile)-lysidine synthase